MIKRISAVAVRFKWLQPLSLMYVLLALFSGLGLAFVIASGPLVQAITVAFFSGHTSSIFDGENVGQFVSVETYIATAFWPPYLVTGLISAIAMIQASTKRAVLTWGTITIGTSLTLVDAFSVGTEGIIIYVLCNFIAGFLLAIFTLILALNANVVHRLSSDSLIVERALWILWPFFGYMFLAGILIFALSFLTTIPSTPTSFRLKPSLSGYYVTREVDTCTGRKAQEDAPPKCELTVNGANEVGTHTQDFFAVLGKFKGVEDGEASFTGGDNRLIFEWKKGVIGPVTGSLWVTQGCIEKEKIEDAIKSEPIFRGELSNLKIAFDEGLSEFRVIKPKSQEIEVTDDNITQFWVTPMREDTEKLQVTRFLMNGVIRTSDKFSPAIYELVIFPKAESDKKSSTHARRVTYAINGSDSKTLDISMQSNLISPDAIMTCEGLTTHATKDGLSAFASAPYISFVVSIEPPKLLNLKYARRSNHVTVSRASGWIQSDGYPKSKLHEAIVVGNLSQLSIFGVVKDLVINGQRVETGETSTLQLSGKLTGRTDGPGILMEGNADYLILNGKRLTTTRWEQLDAGIRIPIILGVPMTFYFLINFSASTLRRRVQRVWMAPNGRSTN